VRGLYGDDNHIICSVSRLQGNRYSMKRAVYEQCMRFGSEWSAKVSWSVRIICCFNHNRGGCSISDIRPFETRDALLRHLLQPKPCSY
jgi:hypothetical protein